MKEWVKIEKGDVVEHVWSGLSIKKAPPKEVSGQA